MAAANYLERIPNNVDLGSNRQLKRALEHWQPRFLSWWRDLGPEASRVEDVYLRTAISVDAEGWASYGRVRMPDYRWGIFLAEQNPARTIGFGDAMGEPVWQQVPADHRSALRRLVVTQGDTEPASVEQQRLLGRTCPSLYDLRNLFQVNVEEGRHLWAMVYLLHAHFGRDGREEAEELLSRHSGDPDKPRILGTFNEPIEDWLSFFMFTYFTDRDGKFQLMSLAESAFDPLARSCRFMLTEEAHHMFVGDTGVARVIQRTLAVMDQLGTEDPSAIRAAGAIDLPTVQRFLNFWFSSSLDLFGSERSSNAASAFATGLKGRPEEGRHADHRAIDDTLDVDGPEGTESVPARNAMNEITRRAYIADCAIGVARWNRAIKRAGRSLELALPSPRFMRKIGLWAGRSVTPAGEPIDAETWTRRRNEFLPTAEDHAFVRALMGGVVEPGKMASWIAPPPRGINSQPLDYDYVRFA
jgi:benzoyl-CoA 2,3-dioxygenase component B